MDSPRAAGRPALDPSIRPGPPRPKSALLINPFYPKDPHASFGKHVLTPSLALTSIAGATPPDWEVALLGREPAAGAAAVGAVPAGRRDHGPPDLRRPGLRAGAVVSRARGEGRPRRAARPVLPRGGRPARRRAGDRRGGAGLAGDPPRRRGGDAPDGLPGQLPAPLPRRPAAAPRPAAPPRLPDHDQPDRHAGLPQPLRLLLPGHRRAGDALPGPRRRAGRRRVPGRRPALRRLRRQQPRLAARVPAEPLPRPAAAGGDLERRRDDRRDRRPVAGPRDGAGGLHGRVRRLRVARGREPRRGGQEDARARRTTPGGWRCCTTTASRSTAASCWASTTTARTSSSGRSPGSRRPGWSAPRSTS